jgi:uncharacterized protein YjbI with pentapeptide repeats
VIAIQIVPEWQVNRASVRSAAANPEAKTTPADVAALQNEMRKTFVQVVGGAFALFALYLTFRRVKVAEQGHITDRYTKAIEQLGALTAAGKPNVEVRLGAIYALERIAQDSPRDHWTIMEVLTAYVRQNAPAPAQAPTKEENEKAIARGPATEIQAILTVLGRRRREREREHEGLYLDLMDSDLRGANFDSAHFEGAHFRGAYVGGADFHAAHVEKADFESAHIEGASFFLAYAERACFYEAHMEGTNFCEAHAEGANFWNSYLGGGDLNFAHMEGACFENAHLEGVFFYGVNLERASFSGAHVGGANFILSVGLTIEQFATAKGWEQAVFDEAFAQELIAAQGKDGTPKEAILQPEAQTSGSRSGEDRAGGRTKAPNPPKMRT